MKYFHLDELFPQKMIENIPEYVLFQMLDPRLIITIDKIRERFGKPMIINNWAVSGLFHYRGYRPASPAIGSPLSQHKFGRAVDFDIEGHKAEEVRVDIIKNKSHDDYKYIRGLEADVNWVHIDFRYTKKEDELFIFGA